VNLADQWPYFEALRTTTSIVFGVMGAFIAIIYPDVLKQGLRSGVTSGAGGAELRRLLDPCAYSAMLLIVLVFLAPLFAWIKSLDLPAGTSLTTGVQQIFFALFCALSYGQISILLMVLMPMDNLLTNTSDSLRRTRLRDSLHSNGRH